MVYRKRVPVCSESRMNNIIICRCASLLPGHIYRIKGRWKLICCYVDSLVVTNGKRFKMCAKRK